MGAQHEISNARIEAVITDLQQRISAIYPEATFEIFEGEDPRGTYLRAIVDVEDPDLVIDLIIDPLLKLQVERQLPLYFVSVRQMTAAIGTGESPH